MALLGTSKNNFSQFQAFQLLALSEVSVAYLAKALAKCLHSPLIGQALQFGLLFVQKTCTGTHRTLPHYAWQ